MGKPLLQLTQYEAFQMKVQSSKTDGCGSFNLVFPQKVAYGQVKTALMKLNVF